MLIAGNKTEAIMSGIESSGRIKMKELTVGDTFEFASPGYCFKRCLFVGFDDYDNMNFVHLTAGGDRYILNNIPTSYDPYVVKEVARSPLRSRPSWSE